MASAPTSNDESSEGIEFEGLAGADSEPLAKEDQAQLSLVILRDVALVSVLLSIFGAAHTWAQVSGLAIASLVAVIDGLVVGVAAGIPLGIGICKLLVKAYDNDLYRLPYHIDQATFTTSVLLTLGFVLLANLAVRKKIMRLDLVEVLKERD